MIDIKKLRKNPKYFEDASAAKNVNIDISYILELDSKVRRLNADIESIKSQKNDASKHIAQANGDERTKLIEDMRVIDRRADDLKIEIDPIQTELDDLLHRIPNPATKDVKINKSEDENEVIRTVGTKRHFLFDPKDHLEIGESLGIIDVERAAKVSGARFTYLKGDGVLLELALVQYAMSVLLRHGFVPVIVPHLVNAESMKAMGYLEHGGHDEIYFLPKDNMYLIGTSEQAIGPMHKDEMLDFSKGPIRYVGFSSCYRREAGSYGKDTRGILRVHQFDKIEMFSFTRQEDSDDEHELILSLEEELMAGLEIPYQVLKMVTGDLGLPAARKYDIEAWMPSQDKYRETHSCSTTTDFQTRRLNTRYKDEEGKSIFAHALNGTAFAMGRTIIAIIENYQNEDGSVNIPKVLRPFMGGKEVILAKK